MTASEPKKTYTKAQVKHEFRLWFADLNASLKADGGKADRQHEWEAWLAVNVEEENLPASALEWKL